MGKILIIRNADFTPSLSGDDNNTGTGESTGGTATEDLTTSLASYFHAEEGFGSSGYTANSKRSTLQEVPISEYFPSRTISITPKSGTAYSIRYGVSSGLESPVTPNNAWVEESGTYELPANAVYLAINFKFTSESGTAGYALADLVESISKS